jgi:hypothetical protein
VLGQGPIVLRLGQQDAEVLYLPDQVAAGILCLLLLRRIVRQHFAQMQAQRTAERTGAPFQHLAQSQAVGLDRGIVAGVFAQLGHHRQARLGLRAGQTEDQHRLHADGAALPAGIEGGRRRRQDPHGVGQRLEAATGVVIVKFGTGGLGQVVAGFVTLHVVRIIAQLQQPDRRIVRGLGLQLLQRGFVRAGVGFGVAVGEADPVDGSIRAFCRSSTPDQGVKAVAGRLVEQRASQQRGTEQGHGIGARRQHADQIALERQLRLVHGLGGGRRLGGFFDAGSGLGKQRGGQQHNSAGQNNVAHGTHHERRFRNQSRQHTLRRLSAADSCALAPGR